MEEIRRKPLKRIRVKQLTALVLAIILVLVSFFYLVARKGVTSFSADLTSRLDVTFGKRESNGIYLGKDDYLLVAPEVPAQEKVNTTMTSINRFASANKDVNTYLCVVPDRSYALADKYPELVGFDREIDPYDTFLDQVGSNVTFVDTRETLSSHPEKRLYYETENIWTSMGAHYAFMDLAEEMDLDMTIMPEIEAYAVSNDFVGSLETESGFDPGLDETIYFYDAVNSDDQMKVVMEYENTKIPSIFDVAALSTEDQLDVFLGGDRGYTDIRTNAMSKDRLLLIKDDYANSLVQFLGYFYREIIVVDPQMYTGSAEKILADNDIDDVLFLYGGDDFVTDERISEVLR